MYRFTIVLFWSLLLSSISLQAQSTVDEEDHYYQLGIEVQVYPTGIIPGVRIEHFLNDKSSLHLRIAAQLIDHRDLGVHDNETGYGGGFSVGYRRFFQSGHDGFSVALRADYWRNYIDWQDEDGGAIIAEGSTTVQVLQPTLMLEYALPISNMVITPSASFGYEWNVTTEGLPTGEGMILLVGLTFGF